MQNLERIRQRKHEKLVSGLTAGFHLQKKRKSWQLSLDLRTKARKSYPYQGLFTVLGQSLFQSRFKDVNHATLRDIQKTAAEETGNEITLKIVKTSAKWLIRPAIISGFSSMKRLGVFLLLPGYDASPSQVAFDINFPGTHFVERGTGRVKCLAHEHNTMSQARARAARSRRSRAH